MAEVISRAHEAFAEHLKSRPQTGDPDADLTTMGEAYNEYASQHPLQYRLMFNTPLPNPEQHPTMMPRARHAFFFCNRPWPNYTLHAWAWARAPFNERISMRYFYGLRFMVCAA